MKPEDIDLDRMRSILQKHRHEKWGLIPVLQEIQEAYGYVPPVADV